MLSTTLPFPLSVMVSLLQMDSRVVSRSIKNEIWPLLRKSGFSAFSARTAWRFAPEQTHVVNFQSFNTYLAERLGCTTVSFGLNLGIYFTAIPAYRLKSGGEESTSRPQEYQCHFRHHPLRRVGQSAFSRADIWYVQPDGMNLPEVMTDVRAVIEQEALPWFDGFGSIEEVLRRLMEEEDLKWFHGTRKSPVRKYCIGHLARQLGRKAPAEQMIAEAHHELERIYAQVSSRNSRRERAD